MELSKRWKDHSEVFDILANFANNDPFVYKDTLVYNFLTNPRQTALEGIVNYFPNHPQTKDLLIDRINKDPDEDLRDFAQQALNKLT